MCDPVSITLGIMSAVSSVQQASAASDAQDAAYEENLRASNEAKKDADRQINLQQAQADEAAATEKLQNDLQTQETLARAVVAGGESGAQGNSTVAAQENIVRQGLEANNMITQNLEREIDQLHEERLGTQSTHTSRVNSVSKGAGVGMGTVLGAIAGGASTGLSTASSMKSLGIMQGGGKPKVGSAASGNPLTSSTIGGFNTRRS
ncbi:MAG: hypothetical protein NZ730_09010 [Porticoccaceae bacterium]|nr:hypothetical protein [Porticoccaceae bacterium]